MPPGVLPSSSPVTGVSVSTSTSASPGRDGSDALTRVVVLGSTGSVGRSALT